MTPNSVALAALIAARESELVYGSVADACSERFSEFVKQGWHVLEPDTELLWSWYLDALCDAVERQQRGDRDYRKLAIAIPPGCAKSLLISVFAPSWEWLKEPSKRMLCFANDKALAQRDSRRMRELITSEWYRRIVDELARKKKGQHWTLTHDQNEKVNFENTARGFRQCLSLGAKVLGKRASRLIIDDALDAKEVINGSVEQVAKRLDEVGNIMDKVLPSRVDNMATARWTLIMQRLHEDDPIGRVIREGGWKVIEIQMEFERDNPRNHPMDPRKRDGELLDERRFPQEEIDALKIKMGNDYSAPYQQRPLARVGGPLKRYYWRYWYPRGAEPPKPVLERKPDGSMHECKQRPLPARFENQRQSWDMAFKDTKASAFVVGQVWGEHGANSFLLDQLRDKMDINATIEAVRTLSARWPLALQKLVEDKANGPAVIGMLRNEIAGLEEVNPEGGKESRANAAAPAAKSGNVYLPHPDYAPWVKAFVAECEAVPGGRYWDQVDTFTQYVIFRFLTASGPDILVA